MRIRYQVSNVCVPSAPGGTRALREQKKAKLVPLMPTQLIGFGLAQVATRPAPRHPEKARFGSGSGPSQCQLNSIRRLSISGAPLLVLFFPDMPPLDVLRQLEYDKLGGRS